MDNYGQQPVAIDAFPHMDLREMQFLQYLPIFMPELSKQVRMPRNLFVIPEFTKMVHAVMMDQGGHEAMMKRGQYIYVTTRYGYASPGNPLNRPGWHCDGFGTNDTNYIWWNRWGTVFTRQLFHDIDPDHAESMRQFEEQIDLDLAYTPATGMLYRLNPCVVHCTPEIPAPGGMRQFVKLSVSTNQYNLEGNSHNYEFDYEWQLFNRDEVRNDPVFAPYGNSDFVPEEADDAG